VTSSKFDVFPPPNLGEGPEVWLRSRGWSFIYADEIKKEKINYSGKI